MIETIFFTNINGESFTLNDDHSPMTSFDTAVEDRTTERDKALQHGIWPAFTYLGKRTFTLEGDLFGDNVADFGTRRRAMKRVFLPRPQFAVRKSGTLYLTTYDITEQLSIDCTTDGDPSIPVEALQPARGQYQINLKAFDPRVYGLPQTQVIIPAASGSGRTYSKTYPLTYVGSSSASDVLIYNNGDIETYPSVRIYGTCTGPAIILFRSDGMVFTVSLGSLVLSDNTHYVDINLKYRTAVMDAGRTSPADPGQNVYSYTLGSQWWALEPGDENQVRYTAASYGSDSYASFVWSDAYML